MNSVIYASKGGNTKKLADAVARAIGTEATPLGQLEMLPATDILFVGASIYAGKIDGKLRAFLAGLESSQVKSVAVFGTAATNQSALPEIRSILRSNGIPVLDEAFHCRGSFLLAHRGRPNDEDLKEAAAFAKRICGAQA